MNYLAHLFLSGDDADLAVGNFIADGVRGSDLENYVPGVQRGIQLHRAIDMFTDAHPVTEEARQLIRPYFRKYAGVALDVYFDHFLAQHWQLYANAPLETFANKQYKLLTKRQDEFPAHGVRFLHHMIANNLLVRYGTIKGIGRVLTGMATYRATFESGLEQGADVLTEHYSGLEAHFRAFFPDLQAYCNAFIENDASD